jgi:hypothetical protein
MKYNITGQLYFRFDLLSIYCKNCKMQILSFWIQICSIISVIFELLFFVQEIGQKFGPLNLETLRSTQSNRPSGEKSPNLVTLHWEGVCSLAGFGQSTSRQGNAMRTPTFVNNSRLFSDDVIRDWLQWCHI